VRLAGQATGYAGVSLQPNAGSQGEYAGLLAIRAWHAAAARRQRDICLIPESAHGTNPASAQMAGMQVVVVKCDAMGNVDLADLRAKCEQHRQKLAAVMITYPSPTACSSRSVKELCATVHEHGGRVYVDGANMNALVGLAAPGEFGGDVSHLNLHKTFCIPHGGGGPGVGPVCVAADLVPFLPARPGGGSDAPVGAVAARAAGQRRGAADQLDVHAHDGRRGPAHATETAILSANYVAARLAEHYDIHYSGEIAGIKGGGVAHECILDLRPLQKSSGVSAEDVAKRLIDYGFHAPTLSFPVAGTLMVEPTESEPRIELDRFCDAMIAIRGEIAKVERGEWPQGRQPAEERAAHRRSAAEGRLAAPLQPRAGSLPGARPAAAQVLGRRWAASTTSGATATSAAVARRCRLTPDAEAMAISVFDLFKIGIGPSSSHTVGPMRAARLFALRLQHDGLLPRVQRIKADLYGSLGATGKGHGSDKAVLLGLLGHEPDTVDVEAIPALLKAVRDSGRLKLPARKRSNSPRSATWSSTAASRCPSTPTACALPPSTPRAPSLQSRVYYSVGGGFVSATRPPPTAPKQSCPRPPCCRCPSTAARSCWPSRSARA
jgi:glycine cleavage system protein P-like pyridoxal-binding family